MPGCGAAGVINALCTAWDHRSALELDCISVPILIRALNQLTSPPCPAKMNIRYEHDSLISSDQFVDLLRRSTLAARRPVDDVTSIAAMLKHANLLCTAWAGDQLVGVARSLTDFEFCCYL